MNRIERLTELNKVLAASEDVFEGIDLVTAKTAVWAFHHQRVEHALMMCEKRGIPLEEDFLYELAVYFRRQWAIDAPRTVRANCALCLRQLPRHEERLCSCFRAVEVGVWILNPTLEMVEWYRRKYSDWEDIVVETIGCVRCSTPDPIPFSIVAPILRQGKTWTHLSRKLCRNCFSQQYGKTSSRPPASNNKHPSVRIPPNPVPKSTVIETLQKEVAYLAPPLGES